MFPCGALIGLAGQGISGILSTINNRKIQQAADAEAARQKAHYDAKANENPLSRSEVQHILGQYDRAAQQQIENARGVAAIKGATPEFAAAVQKGVAEGRANLMGNVAAGASRRADYYNMLGEQAKHQKALDDQQRRYERNQTYAALAANAASAVGSIMDGYSAKKAPAAKSPEAGVTPEQQQAINQKLANISQSVKDAKGLNADIPIKYNLRQMPESKSAQTGLVVGNAPANIQQEHAKIGTRIANIDPYQKQQQVINQSLADVGQIVKEAKGLTAAPPIQYYRPQTGTSDGTAEYNNWLRDEEEARRQKTTLPYILTGY